MGNKELLNYTTFRIGNEPKTFFIIKDTTLLNEVFKRIEGNYFILGGGSNLLISEKIKNYNVIKIENTGISIEDNIIKVEAGENFQLLINTAINNNLKGLEWGSGIPGTVGGAIFGNSGSFGGEIKDNIESVEFFDVDTRKNKVLTKKDCDFSYRCSFFKENKNRFIILRASFKLEKVLDNSEIKSIYIKNLEIKKNTQPIGKYSAGCVFKNVLYDSNNKKLMDFVKNYQEDNIFKEKKQIPTAFLIDKTGLKGIKIGDAEISIIHANFIVNNGKASYRDVKDLIQIIKDKLLDSLDLFLEEEIEEI